MKNKDALTRPLIAVYTSVYPNKSQPNLGLFVRERMHRVSRSLNLVVVAPVPWFPFQSLIRRLRPHFRPHVPVFEEQEGISVYHPRFFCVPGFFKWTDAWFQALGSLRVMRRLKKEFGFDIIDAHFVYPDGVAAHLLGRWLKIPYTITLRGSLNRFGSSILHRRQIKKALNDASRIFTVSESLRREALAWGQDPAKVQMIGNGVDLDRFRPEDKLESRKMLGLPEKAKILISVGGLTERKGFHRIIELMPDLLEKHPDLHYVIAGGANPEGNNRARLESLIQDLGLQSRVHLLGAVDPDELRYVYSSGDIFVLATSFEGWANVLLEASACGLPIVATNVGGNAEVVSSEDVGILVPYGDQQALKDAVLMALSRTWDRDGILDHARSHSWENKIPGLVSSFLDINAQHKKFYFSQA